MYNPNMKYIYIYVTEQEKKDNQQKAAINKYNFFFYFGHEDNHKK